MTEDVQDIQPDAPAPDAAPPGPEWTDDDVQEAKAFGWKAPDEWEGDKPAGYIDDPRRYLERAENFRPFKALRERTAKMEAEYQERLRKVETITERALEAQRAQYERDLQSLNARQRRAVEEADVQTFDQIEKAKAAMQPPAVPVVEQQINHVPPEVQELVARHEWAKNPALLAAGAEILEKTPGSRFMPPQEQFALAERELRRIYPTAFPQPVAAEPAKAPAPQRVDGGGLAFGSGKDSEFSRLPEEAKSTFRRFVNQGLFSDTDADRKRYADDYNEA